jgi:hypothetical protein
LCGIRTISQNFLALKPTFTLEVTTVQSDDSNLALTQAKWRLVGTGSNAHAPDLPSRLCFRKSSLMSLDLSNMYDSPFQVTKFDGIHVSHVAVLLLRRARPSLLPMGRSTKDLRASRPGRRDD